MEPTKVPDAPAGPAGTVPQDTEADHGHETPERPSNVHVFFGVYFAMTGLHGLHVIAGILAIAWVLRRSLKGVFGPQYYTPRSDHATSPPWTTWACTGTSWT